MIILDLMTTQEEVQKAFDVTLRGEPTIVMPNAWPKVDTLYSNADLDLAKGMDEEFVKTMPRATFPYTGFAVFGPNACGIAMKYSKDEMGYIIKDTVLSVLQKLGYPVMERKNGRNEIIVKTISGRWKRVCITSAPVVCDNGFAYGITVSFAVDQKQTDSLYRPGLLVVMGYPNFNVASDVIGGLDESGVVLDKNEVMKAVAEELDLL